MMNSLPSSPSLLTITRSPDDWIIRDGSPSQGLFVLGPISTSPSGRRTPGAYTSYPHHAIGWATREAASAAVAACGMGGKGRAQIIRRGDAVMRFERSAAARGLDWGSTAG